MKHMMFRAMGVVATGITAAASQAQNWGDICIDPANMTPRANFAIQGVGNDLFEVTMGLSGTVTYGGASGPCFVPAVTFNVPGKFAIGIGPRGSVQRTSPDMEDGGAPLTFGGMIDPIGCMTNISRDGNRTMWGSAGFSEFWTGYSNRYMTATSTADNVRAKLTVEVVADAARFRWELTNLDANEAHNIGMHFGAALAMLLQGNAQNTTGDVVSGHFGKDVYPYLPNQRPPIVDVMYDKTLNPSTFPKYVDFLFGQTDYTCGLRIENEPSAATSDVPENQPVDASRLYLGKSGPQFGVSPGILGDISATNVIFPEVLIPDTEFRDRCSFIQVFPERRVEAGQTMQMLHYVRSTWGQSDYKLPYGAVVDAPRLLGTPTIRVDGTPANGDIDPNPFPVRVYVDNVGGYGFAGTEFPLNDVRIKLKFAPNSGMTIAGSTASVPYELERTIQVVQPRDDEFIDFSVSVGPNVSGVVPYTVEIFSQPGNVRKTIAGTIVVAARPRMNLVKDANFVTFPYSFTDTSLETILADFLDPTVPGGDFQAYKWDPIQQGYVITNTAERGKAMWVIYNNTAGTSVIGNLQGNPTLPGGQLRNAPLIQGRGGFNMIGNPYNYDIPINQILGVSASAPQTSRTFRELVELGYVQSFLTTWDPVSKDYVFVDSDTGVMEPMKGYWIRVLTPDDLSLSYPDVFLPAVPEQVRRAQREWKQTENQYKLQLAARNNDGGQDASNFVGQASSADQARKLKISEPPVSPNQEVSLYIEDTVGGQPARMAQSLSETRGRHQWKIVVESKKAGDVTVTWPNLSTLPKSLRFRITDNAANVSRFLRQSSGYTFRMDRPGKREFTLVGETGGVSMAVIGNVTVSQPVTNAADRRSAPFTISYHLSAEATTSVRILSASGKEIYSVSRGRADRAGENSVVWNLRNNANQAVAPGAYRVEILAETATGERIRKLIPVNVIR